MARRVEQHAGNQPRRDEQFRRRGGSEGAEQVIVFRTDGGARVAVGNLVRGLVGFLVGNFGGVKSMVGHQHSLQSVQNQQPGTILKVVEQPFAEFGRLQFLEAIQRLAGDVGEGAAAEIGHDGAALVEGIPEAAGPVPANLGGMLGSPLPGEHALAGATDGVEQENRV